jgi:hypothetical protein
MPGQELYVTVQIYTVSEAVKTLKNNNNPETVQMK